MKVYWIALVLIFGSYGFSHGQKYFTKNAEISFYSDTPMEKIEAHNKSSVCVIDFSDGRIEFSTLIKGFQFDKALMQEHFNENYMESDKFPKSQFKGQIMNYSVIQTDQNKRHKVKVNGDLTIHGITKNITAEADITTKSGDVLAEAEFDILVADFGIEIPAVVRDNIAQSVKINIKAALKTLGSDKKQ